MLLKPSEELLKISEKERIEWAEWLETTTMIQNRGSMSNGVNTACCLHVFECYKQNNGKWFYTETGTPSELEVTSYIDGIAPENLIFACEGGGGWYSAQDLNDDFELSFKQIAQLLRGNSVEIN